MANQGVGLTTGSNAKVTIGGKTMAYATDIQYNVDVSTIPGEVMGKYEVIANESIAYSVNGSFSILRYTKAAENATLPNIATSGDIKSNSPGNWANGQLNPGNILTSTTFDIVIYQKFTNNPTKQEKTDTQVARSVNDQQLKIIKLRDCRVVRRQGGVNKRGMYMETFQFVGILMDDDKTEVAPSGVTGTYVV